MLKSLNQKTTDSLSSVPTPVILIKDTLFFIKNPSASSSTELRAEKISNRLEDLTENYKKGVDTIYLRKGINFINIMYNDDLAFITTKQDALSYDLSLEELAEQQISIFKQSLDDRTSNLSLTEWLLRIGYFVLSIAGLVLFLKLLRWLFNILDIRLSKFDKIFLKKNKNILKYFIPKNTKNIFVFLSNVVRIGITITFCPANKSG